ncbi:protein ZAR1-like isoform X1 [Anolis carolinensis]|uniref:protein ZAR1-like isoform X1 n=1 Tax=Anolis carolinensis TaxID=28377 RepID=UPI002F2B1740
MEVKPGERMEHFAYSPYGIYQGYGVPLAASHNAAPRPLHPQPPPKQQQQQPPNWKQSKGGGNGHIPPPSEPLAHLKALLNHANPRLRRTNTKEAGVQVNPRVDAAVQCSLGPQPLREGSADPCPPGHFPVPDGGEAKAQGGEGEAAAAAATEEKGALPQDGEEEEEEEAPGKGDEVPKGEGDAAGKSGDAEGRSKTTFQFLEQKYGYFHCKDCKSRWESAYVWCISGTNKVYFKQLCRKCQKSFNPYKVEAIQCHICSKTRCACPQKKRHIDLKRPHRQELCGRCKGKRLSCDNTYSFKYII